MRKIGLVTVLLLAIAFALACWLLGGAPVAPGAATNANAAAPSSPPVPAEDAAARNADADRTAVTTTPAADAAAAPFATIRGRCIAAEDGRALAGCEVWLSPPEQTVRTGADGRFEFAAPRATFQQLRTSAADRTPRTAHWSQTLLAGSTCDLGDLRMLRGFSVRGHVVDAAGAGIASVCVMVMGVDTSALAGVVDHFGNSAVTAADGAFTLNAIPAGTWDADLSARTLLPTRLTFRVDPVLGCEPLTIVAVRSLHIGAQVVDERDRPVVGVVFETETGGGRGLSDDHGKLDLWSHKPVDGSTRIRLVDEVTFDPAFAPPTVAWGSEGVQLLVHRGGTLPIAVVDDAGAPVEAFAVLLLHAANPSGHANARERGTHPGGRCAIPDAQPGANTLRVLPTAADLLASEPLTVTVTGRETEPLRVELERLRACPVQVVDAGGAPVGGSRLRLVRVGTRRADAAVTDQDPRATLLWRPQQRLPELVSAVDADPNGSANLPSPRSTRGLLLRVTGAHLPLLVDDPALAPDAPLRVVVTAAAALRGRVALHGQSAELFRVEDVDDHGGGHSCALPADGSFAFAALAAGHHRVRLTRAVTWALQGASATRNAPLAETARDVELRAGTTTELALDLPPIPLATVRGRVLFDGDAGGESLLSLCRVDCDAPLGAFAVAADGGFVAEGVVPGRYRAALSRKAAAPQRSSAVWLAPAHDEFDVPAGIEVAHDVAFAVRRLVLHLRNADGTIASGAVLRCGSHIDAANDRDGELVLDPAPELPVQIARDYAGPWSEPVSMPRDRREHTATVVVPAK